jgi:hypothetical protein
METFPLNNLAENSRLTAQPMIRTMRGVTPDEVARGNRPKWKVATAAKALEAHRRKGDSGKKTWMAGTSPAMTITVNVAPTFPTQPVKQPCVRVSAARQRPDDADNTLGEGAGNAGC